MSDKAEVPNKTNKSYSSLLEKARNNTPNCIIPGGITKMVDLVSKGPNGQISEETVEQKIFSVVLQDRSLKPVSDRFNWRPVWKKFLL